MGVASPRMVAIIFINSGDIEFNTSEPGGFYAGAGWETQGQYGAFSGTPIHSFAFITAKHLGGNVGDAFKLLGERYITVGYYPDPNSDLAIWKVDRPLPFTVAIPESSPEVQTEIIIFGRGTQRGEAIISPDTNGKLRGWKLGETDHRLRWGTNQITAYLDKNNNQVGRNNPNAQFIACQFDNFSNTNECTLSVGDSGGGVYVIDQGRWKLLGINFGVSGPYKTSLRESGYKAAVFDTGSLYTWVNGAWILTPDREEAQPGFFLVSLLPQKSGYIQKVLTALDNGMEPIELQTSRSIKEAFSPTRNFEILWKERIVRIPIDDTTAFIKPGAYFPFSIESVTVAPSGSHLDISFRNN